MSDLINRSETMENYCNALCPKLQKGEYCNDCIVKAWLNNQPIAFDADKVVKEINEWTFNANIDVGDGTVMNHNLIVRDTAIEIVKQGGLSNRKDCEYRHEHGNCLKVGGFCTSVDDKYCEKIKQGGVSDDVCEWKSASDGEFIQNPHTKRLYSNEPSMQNVYCNTCGKKIKVVE